MTDELDVLEGEVEVVDFEELDLGKLDIFKIQFETIDEDIENQAALYAFFGLKEADAYKRTEELRLLYRVKKAEKWKELKASNTKATIPDLKEAVASDSEVVQAKLDLIKAEHDLKKCEALKWALQSKKDMVSSIVGLKRTEMQMYMDQERAKLFTTKEK